MKAFTHGAQGARLRTISTLLGGVSALSIAWAAPAIAQDEPDETDATAPVATDENGDIIVVRGIRGSLLNAQSIKQNADTFVDAVTSEDIGALPDRSVTEALQRVPGVQISRFAAADDPDHFSIEGQEVLVRGLTFVRSELNGRDTFSANNGRALSFSDVPPELLGSVQVFKNQTPDLIEGGIAGSVNLVTRKPFDRDGQTLAGSLEYNYSDFREEWTPTISGLYSNNWEGDFGRFGVLINGVTSELKTRSDGTQISSFQPRDDFGPDLFAPEGTAVRTQDYDRERTGYGGSVQWENPDKTLLATAEFLRSESNVVWTEYASEIATDNIGDNAFFLLPGTAFAFNDSGILSHGVISAPVGWRSDQFSDPRTPIYGLQSNNIRRDEDHTDVTEDASFNLKWTPNDRWTFNADYQHIESSVDAISFGIWGTTYQDVGFDLGGSIPNVIYLPPTEGGDGTTNAVDCSGGPGQNCPTYFDAPHDSFADPYNSFWRSAMDHFEESEGTENAFRGDVEYDFQDDIGWLKSMRAGVRWAQRDQTTRFSTFNWGAMSEIWGNDGPVWMDEVGVPEGVVSTFDWANFQRGRVTAPPGMPFYNQNLATNYEDGAAFADQVVAQWLANGGVTGGPTGSAGGWRRLSERPGVINGSVYLPGEISDVSEETQTAYIRFDYGFDLDSGMTLDGNFGLRWFKTDVTSVGAFQFAESSTVPVDTGLPPIDDPDNPDYPGGQNRCLTPIADDMGAGTGTPQASYDIPEYCDLSAAERASIRNFLNGGSEYRSVDHSYDEILPSFNLRLGLNDDMLVRFAYSKSISRPDVGALRTSFTVNPVTDDDPRTPAAEAPVGGVGFYGFSANGGNAFLDPVKADNFDLSFEWYFAQVGSLTLSAFYKEIEDIIISGTGDVPFTNNGETFDNVYVTQPTNSPEQGTVQGFEIAYQQFYDMLPSPWDGVGIQATYTYIDSSGVQAGGVNPTSSDPAGNDPLVDASQFPLQGLSENNFNLAVIYEKGPISTRLVYNWRDEYLVTTRDVITPFYPIFQNASGQLDGSFFYTVNDNIKLGIQGANLLNEITETTSFIPPDGPIGPRSYFQNDRRVTMSARFTF